MSLITIPTVAIAMIITTNIFLARIAYCAYILRKALKACCPNASSRTFLLGFIILLASVNIDGLLWSSLPIFIFAEPSYVFDTGMHFPLVIKALLNIVLSATVVWWWGSIKESTDDQSR